MKLFLFPFAGGGANYFMSWKTLFSNNAIDIEPVELAGRGKRISDPLYNSMSEAINDVYEWMIAENKLMHDSFAFFGHSMGG
ncbi:hypothetical protein CAI16_19840 [Virgibacillus dokdonensis]|uniref:Thioesterase domain-containing protein n=1 Tax=Virgibacillus dokdonensis TaxID=302167 RepID=A0A3E0WFT2_9BACI|nr:thioesterase domain-containing protein [Virgibacillus dokdonensis]RFA31790.1 hypothetical protein CAI16_19840 [Virgibacillus dokdonensis]